MSRKKQTQFADVIEVASYLLCWAGLIMAVLSYLILHYIAGLEVTPVTGMKVMSGLIWKQVVVTFSSFLQYLIPIAFVVGAFTSAIKQWRRSRIFGAQTSLYSIRKLHWRAFEQLIGEAYRRKGYKVIETPEGADGGVDLILAKDGHRTFVQCKHWKKQKVSVKEVRELNGIVAARHGYSGILVTSGIFTRAAIEFSGSCPVELIDGKKLLSLIPVIDNQKNTGQEQGPLCPKCGDEMVKRTASKGPNIGKQFWGCSTFPQCKGIVNII